jgi:hypothetical protein
LNFNLPGLVPPRRRAPEPAGSLLQLHEEAGIQLRVLPNLWPFWDTVITITLGWSGIRLRNALRRPGR